MRKLSKATQEKKDKFTAAMAALAAMSQENREALLIKMGAVTTCDGHVCSVTNSILLWYQNPDVTVIGGYRQWLALNRQVKSGEKCVYIFVPRVKTLEGEDKISVRFSTAPVFDISQTEERAE